MNDYPTTTEDTPEVDNSVLPYVADLLEEIACMCSAQGRAEHAADFHEEAQRLRQTLRAEQERASTTWH